MSERETDTERKARIERLRRGGELDTIDYIEQCRVRAKNTSNPLYMWRALNAWFEINNRRTVAGVPPLPMPNWCAEYIIVTARRVADLSVGHDYNLTPEPFGRLPRTPNSIVQARRRKRTVSPKAALYRVPEALGFVHRGWNAFDRIRSLEDMELDALTLELYRSVGGKTEADAISMLLDDHQEKAAKPKVVDERSMRKRVSRARRSGTEQT